MKRVVWIDLFPPVQSISVWLLPVVSLIISLRVGGIPGVSIWGSSYTPWSLSMSSLLLNWYWVLPESFARSTDQNVYSPTATQLMITVESCGAYTYGTGHGSDIRTIGQRYIIILYSYSTTKALLLTCAIIKVMLWCRTNWQQQWDCEKPGCNHWDWHDSACEFPTRSLNRGLFMHALTL